MTFNEFCEEIINHVIRIDADFFSMTMYPDIITEYELVDSVTNNSIQFSPDCVIVVCNEDLLDEKGFEIYHPDSGKTIYITILDNT
jgi:hypothetical protein